MPLQNLVEKLKKRSRFYDSSGQSVVEYVLILVVTVSLVIGLGTQIFKPLQGFLKSYMGDYVACLLETGELPSLGSQDAKAALQDQGCNAQFAAASIGSGRPPKASSNSSSSSSESKSASSGSSSSSSDSKSGGSSSSASRGGSSSSFGKGAGGMENSVGKNGKVAELPMPPGEESSFMNRRGSWGSSTVAPGTKKTSIGITDLVDEEKKKLEKKENANRTIASGEGLAGRTKKFNIQKQEPKIAAEEDEPFTFGSFFKFLLIAAIIIALFVVLGSQALNISKSGE
jgi:cobalamin biosynthesis Mg chelatase CobN